MINGKLLIVIVWVLSSPHQWWGKLLSVGFIQPPFRLPPFDLYRLKGGYRACPPTCPPKSRKNVGGSRTKAGTIVLAGVCFHYQSLRRRRNLLCQMDNSFQCPVSEQIAHDHRNAGASWHHTLNSLNYRDIWNKVFLFSANQKHTAFGSGYVQLALPVSNWTHPLDEFDRQSRVSCRLVIGTDDSSVYNSTGL